jgi:hypothetical protein
MAAVQQERIGTGLERLPFIGHGRKAYGSRRARAGYVLRTWGLAGGTAATGGRQHGGARRPSLVAAVLEPTQGRKLGLATGEQEVQSAFK